MCCESAPAVGGGRDDDDDDNDTNGGGDGDGGADGGDDGDDGEDGGDGDDGKDDENEAPPPPPSTSDEEFALKLYWEKGYHWQEDRKEVRWCMRCRHTCRPCHKVRIVGCDWGGDSPPTDFKFIYHGSEGTEVQIQVADRDFLCMEADTRDNEIFLAECDQREQNQRFVAKRGNFLTGNRFEIAPKRKNDWCLTQMHHPKAYEVVCWNRAKWQGSPRRRIGIKTDGYIF